MPQNNAMLNEASKDKSRPREDVLTKTIEQQTAKIPSVSWLGLAIGSMAISMALEVFSGKKKDPANFVGLWVPTFLLFGIYNKLVKLEGSEQLTRDRGYTH
jgi:hypothetical protein